MSLIVKFSKLVMFAEGFGKPAELRMGELARIRLRAIRRGVWFKVLSRLERGLVNLTLKVADRVHSKVLAKALRSIVKKLLEALESEVSLLMRKVGAPLAEKLSLLAQRWGNTLARNWVRDKSFVRFLAVMHMNDSMVFGV